MQDRPPVWRRDAPRRRRRFAVVPAARFMGSACLWTRHSCPTLGNTLIKLRLVQLVNTYYLFRHSLNSLLMKIFIIIRNKSIKVHKENCIVKDKNVNKIIDPHTNECNKYQDTNTDLADRIQDTMS